MKQLSPLQNILFQTGGILLVAGAIMPMLHAVSSHAAVVFALGALLFGCMQMLQRYKGCNFIVRRLRRQQIFGALLLIVSGGLMVMKQYHLGRIRGDEWKITLIVAALLELYTAFRIPTELEKEKH